MKEKSDEKNYSDGLIDGVISCEEEERKLRQANDPKSASKFSNIFNFFNLN